MEEHYFYFDLIVENMKYSIKMFLKLSVIIAALSLVSVLLMIIEKVDVSENIGFGHFFSEIKKPNVFLYGILTIISLIVYSATNQLQGYNLFKPPIDSGSNIGKSKYGYWNIYKRARKKVILCAQNHYYLSILNILKFEESIKVLQRKNIKVDLLMDDVNFFESSITWLTVNQPNIYNPERYKPFDKKSLKENSNFLMLIKATRNLYRLQEKYENFNVFVKPHVPISMTFIDPEEKNGFIVITPNFFKGAHRERPYFVINKKRNKEVFENYWDTYYSTIESRLLNKLNNVEQVYDKKTTVIKINGKIAITMDKNESEIIEIKKMSSFSLNLD